jgi:hypothetical protein
MAKMMGTIKSYSCGSKRVSQPGKHTPVAWRPAHLLQETVRDEHDPVLVPGKVFDGEAALQQLGDSLRGRVAAQSMMRMPRRRPECRRRAAPP